MIEESRSVTSCHELCSAGTGDGKRPRAAAGHRTFLFVGLDFAAQPAHVLGRDLWNIWRRALPASESSLLREPRLEMYVRCDLCVRRLPP